MNQVISETLISVQGVNIYAITYFCNIYCIMYIFQQVNVGVYNVHFTTRVQELSQVQSHSHFLFELSIGIETVSVLSHEQKLLSRNKKHVLCTFNKAPSYVMGSKSKIYMKHNLCKNQSPFVLFIK